MTEDIFSSVEQSIPHANPTIIQDVAAGSITYGKTKTASLVSHPIYIGQVRGPTGLVTTATLAAGVFAEVISSNVHALGSELADSNTKTSVGTVQFQLPENYVPGGLITVRVTTKLKKVAGTGAADNGSDMTLAAYLQSKVDGTVGATLVASGSPATYAAVDTVYAKDFTITPTGLVAGNVLNLLLTTRAIENDAGNGSLQNLVYNIEVLCDVYGAA